MKEIQWDVREEAKGCGCICGSSGFAGACARAAFFFSSASRRLVSTARASFGRMV